MKINEFLKEKFIVIITKKIPKNLFDMTLGK